MKILISGATGMIGSALKKSLLTQNHSIVSLSRKKPDSRERDVIGWDPFRPLRDPAVLEDFDAVIHLAGESIAARRWSENQKILIRESRVQGTEHITAALMAVKKKPQVFISASAIGYYGNRGNETLTEKSSPGSGFLPDVCQAWEEASKPLSQNGVSVAHLRFGIVLSRNGGALQKMLLPFKMGVGGKVGDGHQYMSWVDLDDVIGAIEFALNGSVNGPVNVTSPQPVNNLEFTKTLGKVLVRPTVFPLPAFAARLALGEMADALLLSSAKVMPEKILKAGYSFRFPVLEDSLNSQLK